MRIIKEGKLPVENPTHNVICFHCRTELEFEQSEADYHCNQYGDYLEVVCPFCKKVVTTSLK